MVRAGKIVSGLAVFLLLLDAVGKLTEHAKVIEGTVRLGYPAKLGPHGTSLANTVPTRTRRALDSDAT